MGNADARTTFIKMPGSWIGGRRPVDLLSRIHHMGRENCFL